MSRTYLYTCDICGKKVTGMQMLGEDSVKFIGLHFISIDTFERGKIEDSGKHICKNCCEQLERILNDD